MVTESIVRVGTSGYSFDHWCGGFYPENAKKREMLSFYASKFDAVELNYTFYSMPSQNTSRSMVRQVPKEFSFVIKANAAFSHRGDLSGVPEFLGGIDPIVEAGHFGGMLFQFPASYTNTKENRDYVKHIVRVFDAYAISFEFRHNSWGKPFVRKYFEDNNLCLVVPDLPALPFLYPRIVAATSDIGYIRFHSRNASLWNAGKQRFDYDYSTEELKEWLPLLETMADQSPTIYAFFNNCYRGQAAANATAFKELIGNMNGPLALPEMNVPPDSVGKKDQ